MGVWRCGHHVDLWWTLSLFALHSSCIGRAGSNSPYPRLLADHPPSGPLSPIDWAHQWRLSQFSVGLGCWPRAKLLRFRIPQTPFHCLLRHSRRAVFCARVTANAHHSTQMIMKPAYQSLGLEWLTFS